ncbi:MAG: nuclear transport factor 2 family protein [Bacteroidia bacterium]|nr:nuclear transport factor 2 family protein [Bacteroidia bacterium]
MKNFISIFLLLTLLGSFSSVFAQDYYGKEKDIQQILKNIEAFSKAFMANDVQGLVDSYTADGKIFPGGRNITEGRSDLEKYWLVPEGVTVLHHKVTPTEIRIVKKYAYDFGYYEGKTKDAKGEVNSWKGKYVIVWRKVGKDWKIYLDIWNNI